MEYTEDADRRELLLHSAYDSDTVRADCSDPCWTKACR